ncbi:hypothetical protein GCM10010339_88000 [Streptomyces alanosinicus]|uniref:Uncharacterized protein n=1 Tax=Streptomyces alanosinicus TaxID=68171 RepID=A0A918YV63_9ACTN|nr:hypothetical protein [Streptomyces alanosinicus]GHE14959.1 hypothetical protein GCM10010339_88000 [Streptomyces alanosinicus]
MATTRPADTPGAVATATRTAPSSAVVHGCDGRPVRSPARFTLICGDGKVSLGDLVWSNWGQPTTGVPTAASASRSACRTPVTHASRPVPQRSAVSDGSMPTSGASWEFRECSG